MCNRLPEINKNGDAGIFPVYYSLKELDLEVRKVPGNFLKANNFRFKVGSYHWLWGNSAVVL